MSDCPRVGKFNGGCKFSPRYDLGPALTDFNVRGANIVDVIEATKAKTYVRDVCETCGRTVERERAA